MADELDNTIRENASGPKRASGDSGSVDQHSLADQIEADKYLAGKTAVSGNAAFYKADGSFDADAESAGNIAVFMKTNVPAGGEAAEVEPMAVIA